MNKLKKNWVVESKCLLLQNCFFQNSLLFSPPLMAKFKTHVLRQKGGAICSSLSRSIAEYVCSSACRKVFMLLTLINMPVVTRSMQPLARARKRLLLEASNPEEKGSIFQPNVVLALSLCQAAETRLGWGKLFPAKESDTLLSR